MCIEKGPRQVITRASSIPQRFGRASYTSTVQAGGKPGGALGSQPIYPTHPTLPTQGHFLKLDVDSVGQTPKILEDEELRPYTAYTKCFKKTRIIQWRFGEPRVSSEAWRGPRLSHASETVTPVTQLVKNRGREPAPVGLKRLQLESRIRNRYDRYKAQLVKNRGPQLFHSVLQRAISGETVLNSQ